MKLAMVIDSTRCIDCKACLVSCKTANGVPAGQWRNWVKEALPQDPLPSGPQGGPVPGHYQPGACMHCANPTCVAACPSGAPSRNADTGEVLIDRALCIGCGNCIPACPYGARYKHAALHVADKCDYCAPRRAQGLEPACVGTCPTRSRVFGDLDDPSSEAAQRLAAFPSFVRVENAQSPTAPNMIYVKNTAPVDWAHPAETPASMSALTGIIRPLVKLAVGLTGLGVLGALARQIFLPETPPASPRDPDEHGKEEGHD